MKIYTKKGDSGSTALIGGTRVPKHHLRIESYGTVDELNSHLGLLRDQQISDNLIEQILYIQDRLFTMGSLLASDGKNKMKLPELQLEDIQTLEKWIDEMDAELEPMRNFVLPGGHQAVSVCHIARCVCRRAERASVHLNEVEALNPLLIAYLNRLSDYLFVLSRKLSKDLGVREQAWTPKY